MMLVKGQERRVKSKSATVALRNCSGSRLLTLGSRLPRSGVTLIELLIVITIISILAALVLGVAAVANETARQAQTKHIVERLHTLLTEFYGTFKTRRVKLNPAVESAINSLNKTPAEKRQLLAEARLYALREMMLMEVPDRWSDVILSRVPTQVSTPATINTPLYIDTTGSTSQTSGSGLYGRTPLAAAYLRRYQQLTANFSTSSDWAALMDNQGAECLYMIITMACGDGEARSLFKEADIGDTDGDGAPEFLDAWGHPINFLRWAPGFDSQIQLNQNVIDQLMSGTQADIAKATGDIAKDHDPFDVYRVEQASGRAAAFRLVPLIYSGGRDGAFGITLVKPYVTWIPDTSTPPAAGFMLPGYPRLSPYYKITDVDDPAMPLVYLGSANADGTATDNIHNHLLGTR
jgi:prepilin-type N-terminal cleavage/methylation domain-containing protein